MSAPETLRYDGDALILIDQTKLPCELTECVCRTPEQAHDAIRRLVVRGAPAIGIAAAYGVCLTAPAEGRTAAECDDYLRVIDYLATSRPTAVNLFWALNRMRHVVHTTPQDQLRQRLVAEARLIHEEDRRMCEAIGRHGAPLIDGVGPVLTHCNAGGLATSTLGTALSPIYELHRQGRAPKVYADETRPLMQGARLTAWELAQAGVDVTVITDSMAGALMRCGLIDAVIVGADRITSWGDVANKIGTYTVAVLARHHGLPFYVAAPTNTFDLELECGDEIPIEERDRSEIAAPFGLQTVPDNASVINPAFDVTPADLITAIITERGVIYDPDHATIAHHFVGREVPS